MVKIDCPTCGARFETSYWQSLNAELNPAEKEQLLSGKLFYKTCPKCNSEHQFVYPIIYHDMAHKVMIYLALNEEDAETIKKHLETIDKSPMVGLISFAEYQYRIVLSTNELREKAMIFNCGFDDRVIELIKVQYRTAFAKEQPHEKQNSIMFYSNIPHKLAFLVNIGATFTIVLKMEAYESTAETRKNELNERSKNCFFIDEKWALALLSEHPR
jgi:uncharacterized protein (UPF0212 family)